VKSEKRLCVLSLLCTLCTAIAAQRADSVFNLNDVVVTATRTPKLLKDVPIQTRLITLKDIERTDATDVQDLLQQEMPGVEFSYAMNQQRHMNFCGFGGQSILFLIDGERLAGETLDDVDFTRLNMANVQRIEIVKGAASALYGSNAGGGVVNIITKDGGKPWALNLNARLARHNEQRYGGNWTVNSERVANTLNFNYNGTDNYSVKNAPNPQALVYGMVYGDKTYHVKDKVTFRPIDGMKIVGRAGYFYRTLSRTADNPERYRDFSAGLRGLWQMGSNDHLDIAYAFDQYDKSDFQEIARLDIRDYSNVQNSVRAVYNHGFSGVGTLTVGADYLHDYLFNKNLEGENCQQDAFDAFAQMDWNVSARWELVGALRYDYFSDHRNSHLTPKLTARYKILDNLTLRFGYGMGFRAPTLKERYYNFDMAGIWTVQGNPQLQSEVSHNVNIAAEWTRRKFNLTVSTYYNNMTNKIATGIPYYSPEGNGKLFLPYINLKNYSVCGAEMTMQVRFDNGFSGKLSYAITSEHLPQDKDGTTISNQYIPARTHSLIARFDWDKQFTKNYGLSIGLNGRFLSAVNNEEYVNLQDISQGTKSVCYPAYTLWKLSTVQRFGKAVRLTLALDNLFNYIPTYYYYNAPVTDGISFQAGVSVDIDNLF